MIKNNLDISKTSQDPTSGRGFKKNWFYYLFLLSNITVVIGGAISLSIVLGDPESSRNWKTPSIVCNLLALLILALFLFFEIREIIPMKFHVKPKRYKVFMVAISSFIFMILFSSLYVTFYVFSKTSYSLKNYLIIYLAVTMFWTLINIGVYSYSRFNINKDVFRRKNGIIVDDKKEHKRKRDNEREIIDNMVDDEFKSLTKRINTDNKKDLIGKKASSGLDTKPGSFDEE